MRARTTLSLLLVAALAAALVGCPGHLENPEDFVGSSPDGAVATCTIGVSAVEAQLIRPRCATANCHDRAGHAGGLDLETPGLAGRLLNVRSTMCSGRVLVDPTSPAAGYFVEKLSASPRCGGRMPLGAPALSAGELTCVRGWLATLAVDAGAPMDAPRDTGADATADARDVASEMNADAPSDARPMDASDVTDASDGSDVSDASDVSDGSDVSDASDAGDVTDASDVTDAGGDVRDASSDAGGDVRDASGDAGGDGGSDASDGGTDAGDDAGDA